MSREVHVRFWERLGVKFPGRLDNSDRLGCVGMARRLLYIASFTLYVVALVSG